MEGNCVGQRNSQSLSLGVPVLGEVLKVIRLPVLPVCWHTALVGGADDTDSTPPPPVPKILMSMLSNETTQ